MKSLRDFDIDIFRLGNEPDKFHYTFDDKFFEKFENSLISKGNGTVDLVINKTPTLMELDFKLEGEVELLCDRSLDPYQHKFDSERHLIIKFGEIEEELSDEIIMVHWDTQRINVAQYIYEFIGLEVPMKKLHPRYEGEEEDESEEVMIYQSKEEEKEDNKDIDPRWEALKGLKNKKQ